MCNLHQLEVKMSISCSYILHFTFILRLLFFCLYLPLILIKGLDFLLDNYIRNRLISGMNEQLFETYSEKIVTK